MRELLQTVRTGLRQRLQAGFDPPPEAAPFVYVTAIRSDAGMTRSLAGITLISRAIGFDLDAATLYSSDCSSATYHAQHNSHPVALAVEVCPPRQTVSIAVSGHDDADTYALFLEADARLFGAC
jgi:hypothetical protein